jgi:hypothetical protein
VPATSTTKDIETDLGVRRLYIVGFHHGAKPERVRELFTVGKQLPPRAIVNVEWHIPSLCEVLVQARHVEKFTKKLAEAFPDTDDGKSRVQVITDEDPAAFSVQPPPNGEHDTNWARDRRNFTDGLVRILQRCAKMRTPELVAEFYLRWITEVIYPDIDNDQVNEARKAYAEAQSKRQEARELQQQDLQNYANEISMAVQRTQGRPPMDIDETNNDVVPHAEADEMIEEEPTDEGNEIGVASARNSVAELK